IRPLKTTICPDTTLLRSNKKAESNLKQVKDLKKWVEDYENAKNLIDELPLALDFFKEKAISENELQETENNALKALEDLELKNRSEEHTSELQSREKIVC